MTDQKMKPSTIAALMVYLPGVCLLGMFYFLYFSDIGKNTTYVWKHVPVFRLRMVTFLVVSFITAIIGFGGMKRWIELRMGQEADDLKKANLELQAKD